MDVISPSTMIHISLTVYFLASFPLIARSSSGYLATDFAGVGYDLIRGNPEGASETGGIDPGFRLTHFLFNRANNTSGKKGYYNGNKIYIPDIVEYQSASSCAAEEKVSMYDGSESYQNSLSANVEVEGTCMNVKYLLCHSYLFIYVHCLVF